MWAALTCPQPGQIPELTYEHPELDLLVSDRHYMICQQPEFKHPYPPKVDTLPDPHREWMGTTRPTLHPNTHYLEEGIVLLSEQKHVNSGSVLPASFATNNVNDKVDVDVIKSEREDNNNNNDTKGSGVEWLLGSRNKIILTSERLSKKRKLLGGDAGLEKLLVLRPKGGALNPVRKRGAGNDDGGVVVAHLFCCQWMSEVYIEDTKSMEPVMNVEGIREMQKKLVCYLCKTRSGACVRCSFATLFNQDDDDAGCWLCSWCKLKGEGDRISDGNCVLCPQKGGALNPVRKRGAGNDDDGDVVEFAHLFCCQWMSEVSIEDTKSMEPIMSVEGIKEMQKKLVCYLCKD
ncbi:zinc finger, FYVE/PHD-type containing protein [Tanacetum coccineum]